ncbi:MAG: ABC transporter ATP-binding protein [Thermodesulfobacteriota bacterium]|nr:ABC transporter ATP-binding protein [Thermodesulfobacteriota bacterium]
MVQIRLKGITKFFGNLKAVDNVDLVIEQGELFTLLGPSGCGKTTTLRIIAGFVKPDLGELYFDNHCITDLPAHKRNTGMIFQDYALFPNLNVYRNVAYGLKARKINKRDTEKKVAAILEKVGLQGFEKRFPNELSGGQQQRVALARALVIEPQALLMDEPLSNLDANLRINMREVIKRLQKDVNITTVFVTHDQEEAISISDRIAILKEGHIEQIAAPIAIYQYPKNKFVAEFIGSPNLLEGTMVSYDGAQKIAEINIDGEIIRVTTEESSLSNVICCIRPEQIEIANPNSNSMNRIKGRVLNVLFTGPRTADEIQDACL